MSNVLDSVHRGRMWRGGRVDSVFDLFDRHGFEFPEAGHCVTTVGKLFTPTVHSEAEGLTS